MITWTFHSRDVARGMAYYKQGRVKEYFCTNRNGTYNIRCVVQGTNAYRVELDVGSGFINSITVTGECSCLQFSKARKCKHMAAALFAFRELGQTEVNASDKRVDKLIKAFLELPAESDAPAEGAGDIRFVPVIDGIDEQRGLLKLSFRIGRDRLYVVRDLTALKHMFDECAEHAYGKKLTLRHDINALDPRSRAMLKLVFNAQETYAAGNSLLNTYYSGSGSIKQEIPFTGRFLSEFFDLYLNTRVERYSDGEVLFCEGDPKLTLRLTPMQGGARLHLEGSGLGTPLVTSEGTWLLTHDRLMRLSSKGQKLLPLIAMGNEAADINERDLDAFCSSVLPEIRDSVDIVDESGLLDRHLPDSCTPRFHLDMRTDRLLCRLSFDYGGVIVLAGKDVPSGNIHRNAPEEARAERFLLRDFKRTGDAHFMIDDADRSFAYLAEKLDALREMGEVYLSSSLSQREYTPQSPAIGISVSDGTLLMDFDTGGFPPEELESLYDSLLLRKKYYRLRDGRFMTLGGDAQGLGRLAEIAHMTQLKPRDLANGHAELPAYRGLYLDDMLRGEDMRVDRDGTFREMVRKFKTVADSDYAFPENIKGRLRGYQEIGYRWLKTLESCGFGGILADEMGLGKTLQMIVFFASHYRKGEPSAPSLVVCPTSLVYNWKDEIERFAPDLTVKLILGTAAARRALLSEEGDEEIWVTSYDLLKRDIEHYDGRMFYCCVLDEGQFVKNASTLASKSVKRINAVRRFVMTGTPIENRLSELWNLFDFLMPGYLFSQQRFVEKLERPIVQSGSAEAQSQLKRLVQPFLLRRRKADVLKELPPKQEYVRRIMLSEGERKVYAAQAQAALKQLDKDSGKLSILAALMRLRQICCDPNLCFENYKGETSKLEACLELVDSMVENGHQILLFSQFTSMLENIRAKLAKSGISYFVLQGSTSKEERQRIVRAFNAGQASVMLISLKAGGTGLNLTAADVVIHYDPWWNQAAQDQATDRAHRIGQKERVQVYKLIAENTVEERILELQEKKGALLDSVTEGGEGILGMTAEEMLKLLE